MNLTKILYSYYDKHARDLPWRRTTDPYAILVSETMLQQTQVTRVIDKYLLWMNRYPTLQSLAESNFPEVVIYWIGLGYNRRAKYLYEFSQEVKSKYNGQIPTDRQLLLKLPGIGPYTSAAVCVFAYNQPLPLIETNVRTVFIYHFFQNDTNITDKQLLPLITQHMDKSNPRKWFNAVMDYGTYLKNTVGNQNRQSKHYSKQSKFEGSLRQIRGHIIKSLVNRQKIFQTIQNQSAINSLQKDGLIEITQDGEIVLKQ